VKPAAAALLARVREQLSGGDPEETVRAFERYLAVQPGDALAWADMAGILVGLQRHGEALEACARALALQPNQASALFHQAAVYLRQGKLKEAEALLDKVLALAPGRVDALLALTKCRLGRLDPAGAKALLDQVLAVDPANIQAHQFLGQIFYGQGRWPEFHAEMERFRQVDPTSRYLEFETGFENLLRGVMPEGWLQWEARLDVPGCVGPERNFQEPRWTGESFAGKTLLVHYEQGLGDTLMLIRYLPLVKARGGRVLLLVQPRLAYLVTTCPGIDQVIPEGMTLPPFDLQVSLFSLPAVFKTDLDSIPADIPYLGIPPQVSNAEAIAGALTASEGRTRVGLAWAGFAGHARDAERSIPVEALAPLGALPGVAWHGLQTGREETPSLPGYLSLAPWLTSFSDTAYALSGMDLVITVDTALAHLAGALGIPTLLLVTHVPDFRWMLERDDSPWYPTLRIYRQPRPGDWASVMRALVGDLSES